MKYKTKPTLKQENSFKNIIENRGNISKGMKDAGYSEATAKNPSNLTKSKGFQSLLASIIDDEDLITEINDIAFNNEDKRTKLQAIDMLLKLKDLYPAQKSKVLGLFDTIARDSE